MGILKNFEGDGHESEPINPVSPLDLITNPNHFSDASSSSEDEDVQPTPSAVVTPAVVVVPVSSSPSTSRPIKVKKMVSKLPKPMLHVKSLGGKKSQGNRHARRHENMCFLLNLAKDLDEDFAEVTINDLVETTISAFAQLLLSKSKMKIWNEFIELPENQQERLIKLSKEKKVKKSQTMKKRLSETNIDSFVLVESPTSTINIDNDKEEMCPLRQDRFEEANVCFRRIDSHIRLTLKSLSKRNHLPLERIGWFEEDLIPFFMEHPDSIYLRQLEQSFDRMLLHAVCQYLNLLSKSSTRDGQRYTEVENRRDRFHLPTILLSTYLKQFEHD